MLEGLHHVLISVAVVLVGVFLHIESTHKAVVGLRVIVAHNLGIALCFCAERKDGKNKRKDNNECFVLLCHSVLFFEDITRCNIKTRYCVVSYMEC